MWSKDTSIHDQKCYSHLRQVSDRGCDSGRPSSPMSHCRIDHPLQAEGECRHDQVFANLPAFVGAVVRKGPPFIEQKMKRRGDRISRQKSCLLSPPIGKELAQSHEDERYGAADQTEPEQFGNELAIEHYA